SATPTRSCIQPSNGNGCSGTARTSHSRANQSASQNTAPATPVGGRKLREVRGSLISSASGIVAIVHLAGDLSLLFPLLLPCSRDCIPRRREMRSGEQQQAR